MGKLKLEASAVTDAGTVRTVNEDSYLCKIIDAGEHYSGIFAVADGVGGLERGDIASLSAIANINKWWMTKFRQNYPEPIQLKNSLLETMRTTNRELIEFGSKNNIKLATTLTSLLVYKGRAVLFHTGDSRIYRLKKGMFAMPEQLTVDHSCLVKKNVNNKITEKWMLTDCLGNKEEYKTFIREEPLDKSDLFLVCSDGMYKTMNSKRLASLIKKNRMNPAELAKALVDTAKQNGEKDNITVIAIRLYE